MLSHKLAPCFPSLSSIAYIVDLYIYTYIRVFFVWFGVSEIYENLHFLVRFYPSLKKKKPPSPRWWRISRLRHGSTATAYQGDRFTEATRELRVEHIYYIYTYIYICILHLV